MEKITELTPEQEAMIPVYHKKYLEKGVSTDETDYDEVIDVITQIYEMHDFKKPNFIFCPSPYACNVLINVFKDKVPSTVDGPARFIGFVGGHADTKSYHMNVIDFPAPGITTIMDLAPRIKELPKIEFNYTYFWGQFDLYWICFYKYCKDVLGITYEEEADKKLELMQRLSFQTNFIYFFENYVFISAKPTKINGINDYRQLHSETEPAMLFKDGFRFYAVNGHRIPDYIIENPEQITIEKIHSEENAEIRLVMMKKYGVERYMKDTGAVEIDHHDKFGTLYNLTAEGPDKDLKILKCINRTPEPDGSFEIFYLPTPQEMKDAHEAVAWTFRRTKETYNPEFET